MIFIIYVKIVLKLVSLLAYIMIFLKIKDNGKEECTNEYYYIKKDFQYLWIRYYV